MNKENTKNLTGNRVLLAGASIFIIMPALLFITEKLISYPDINNPKLIIGVIFGGVVLIDTIFVKFYKTRNDKNT